MSLEIPENQFEICHCRHTFQLNVDGFGKGEKGKKMPTNYQNKGEFSQWDETWALLKR